MRSDQISTADQRLAMLNTLAVPALTSPCGCERTG